MEFFLFLKDVLLPAVIVLSVLMRIGKSHSNERLLLDLIGVLAQNGTLTVEQLAQLHLFEPRGATLLSELKDLL